jgi:hypothetical protein
MNDVAAVCEKDYSICFAVFSIHSIRTEKQIRCTPQNDREEQIRGLSHNVAPRQPKRLGGAISEPRFIKA